MAEKKLYQIAIGSNTYVIPSASADQKGLMSKEHFSKLEGIEAGAQVNVQSDWNATEGDAFIKNKPTLGTASDKDVEYFDLAGAASTAESNAIAHADNRIGELGNQPAEEGVEPVAHTVKSFVEAKISEVNGAAEELEERVDDLEGAIDVLNGEGDGSVHKTVADAIAEVVAEAPEKFDTLKEVADWIASDTEGAAKMQSDIATLMGAETVNGSVAKALKDAKDYADGLDSVMDARVDALEALHAEGKTVAQEVAAGIADLDAEKEGKNESEQIAVKVTEVDGKITNVAVTAAKFDLDGAANTAESNAKAYALDLVGEDDTKGVRARIKANEDALAAIKFSYDESNGLLSFFGIGEKTMA